MLSPLCVKGLALPYNVSNSYGETMDPHALDGFLKEWKLSRKPIKMLAEHSIQCGRWSAFVNKPNGLYLKGWIEDHGVAEAFAKTCKMIERNHGHWLGLSVTFINADDTHKSRSEIINKWEQRLTHTKPPERVMRAYLDEVSITAEPAWQNTWVRRCNP